MVEFTHRMPLIDALDMKELTLTLSHTGVWRRGDLTTTTRMYAAFALQYSNFLATFFFMRVRFPYVSFHSNIAQYLKCCSN